MIPRILVIGDLMLDHYLWGRCGRISPEAPVQIVEIKDEDDRLGGSCNVMHNLTALQAKVFACGVVGQDTDALTNPFEADAAWAIGKNKTFFVGSRSLDILRKKPLTRRLVGLTFPTSEARTLPEECNLIVAVGELVGRITSIAPRSTLGCPRCPSC